MNQIWTKSVFTTLLLTLGISISGFGDWQQPPKNFSDSNAARNVDGATDGNGNAISVWTDFGLGLIQASYYTNGAWGPNQTLDTLSDEFDAPHVEMDASGTGLVIWTERVAGNVRSRLFSGGVWSTPTPDPIAVVSAGTFAPDGLAMNGSGQGVGVFIDAGISTVNGSFFSGGSWSPPTVIGTGTDAPTVSYSPAGTAVATWINSGAVTASYTIAGVWQAPVVIGASSVAVRVGTDASGNAFAAWIDGSGDLYIDAFDGATWAAPQLIASGPGNTNASIAVAPGGTAIVIWIDGSSNGQLSTYDGATWSAPIQFGTDLATSFATNLTADVSVDSVGNALIVYGTNTPQTLSVQLPIGGSLTPALVIQDEDVAVLRIVSALSEDGLGFAFWFENSEGPDAFGSALFPIPTPPRDLAGRTCQNKFASQTDRVNIITWNPSLAPSVTAYYLSRNSVLIATIPAAGPYIYYDHCRKKDEFDVYTLTAVNILGEMSTPVMITIKQ